MKRTGNLIEKIADKENLYLAFYKAIKGKPLYGQYPDLRK
jgi:hypothetical protein